MATRLEAMKEEKKKENNTEKKKKLLETLSLYRRVSVEGEKRTIPGSPLQDLTAPSFSLLVFNPCYNNCIKNISALRDVHTHTIACGAWNVSLDNIEKARRHKKEKK